MTKILIVDDEADVLKILEILFRIAGHSVERAQSAEHALEVAAAALPDIVVSDLMMPGLNGLELCSRLRSAASTRRIPIVLSSAAAEEPPGRGTLYDAFVPKPVDIDEMLAVVRRLTA